jgi:hypothetical protein
VISPANENKVRILTILVKLFGGKSPGSRGKFVCFHSPFSISAGEVGECPGRQQIHLAAVHQSSIRQQLQVEIDVRVW